MIRPQTAFQPRRSFTKQNKINTRIKNSTMNQMNQSNYHFGIARDRFNNIQSSVQQCQNNINEIQSQNANKNDPVQFNKTKLAAMLMKVQLQKMGFRSDKYQKQIQNFLKEHIVETIQIKNVRQWVLSRKSQMVQIILNAKSSKIQNSNMFLEDNNALQFSQQKNQMVLFRKKNIQIMDQNPINVERNSELLPLQTKIVKIQNFRGQQQLQMRKKEQESVICPICLDQTKQFIARKCGHTFCKYCIKNYILQNSNSGNFIIDCPEVDCVDKIDQKQASGVLNKADLQRFVKFKQKVQLQIDPNNKFCTRPDCGSLLVYNQDKKLYCKVCSIIFCEMCQEPQHPHKDCIEALQRQMDQAYRNFRIKKCPSCSAPIQKIDGCNHMTCKKCKNEFCWICLQKYTPYHYRIYNCCGCPGLQFQQVQQMGYKRFLQVIFFIFLPLFIALSIAAIFFVLPLYMIFSLFTRPCKWLSQSNQDQKCQIKCVNVFCCCIPQCVKSLLCYLLFFPRSILFMIFLAPFKYFRFVAYQICNNI